MTNKRKIEVFTAGCAVCDAAASLVKRLACPSCDVQILNTLDKKVAQRAIAYGLRSLPAIVIDGRPADCCSGRGVDEAALRRAGIGTPI